MKLKKMTFAGLSVFTVIALASCGNTTPSASSGATSTPSSTSGSSTSTGTKGDTEKTDSELYNEILGDFYSVYKDSLDEEDTDVKYAKMALAEAKLLSSGVMVPTRSDGGRYGISSVAPYSIDYAKAGNDDDRFHQALVTTTTIKNNDRTTMKAKWNELKGTGAYEKWAKNYLAQQNYTLKDTYNIPYATDPQTWDALATSRASDSEAIVNTYDGLVEYDVEGTLKMALAENYSVSDDGLTYTFKIRQGVKWVDSQGRALTDVKADDFVAGFQHMLDSAAGLEYLVDGKITGVSDYLAGLCGFDDVGVKAVDDYTLTYTLEEKTSYFMSMLGYGVFAPLSRSYYTSKGGKFGSDYDATASDYTYGKTADDIAYCGPYLVTNNTAESRIVFSENPLYYNKDNVNIKTITWLYNDGTDVTKAYTDYKNKTIDSCALTTATVELAKNDKLFNDYVFVNSTGTTSYMAFYNVNRKAYSNVNDGTLVSTKTSVEKANSNTALQNTHFRLALSFAFDRSAYNSQLLGSDVATNSLRNSYTPGDFVQISKAVTIKINGEDKTFAAGTYYGEIVQAQLTSDGSTIKVWDSTAEEGKGSSDGFDGWYNAEEAVKELNAALKELSSLNISSSNPIKIDYPYYSGSQAYANQAQAYKKSIETVLGGNVIINLVECSTPSSWYYAGYYTETGAQANYDFYDVSGWGPDYLDPSTYLDTFLPDGAGYMVKCIGLF